MFLCSIIALNNIYCISTDWNLSIIMTKDGNGYTCSAPIVYGPGLPRIEWYTEKESSQRVFYNLRYIDLYQFEPRLRTVATAHIFPSDSGSVTCSMQTVCPLSHIATMMIPGNIDMDKHYNTMFMTFCNLQYVVSCSDVDAQDCYQCHIVL